MSYKNFYELLGVTPKANIQEIRRSYHLLARKYHPDTSQEPDSEAMFQKIAEAYGVLSDPDKRAEYDLKRGTFSSLQEKLAEYERNQGGSKSSKSDSGNSKSKASNEYSAKVAPKTDGFGAASFGEEPSSARRKAKPESTAALRSSEEGAGVLGRLVESFKVAVGKLPFFKRQDLEDEPYFQDPASPESLRGERLYQFTIDALEALRGTTRELAVRQAKGPRVIRVNIPAGITDQTMLRVSLGEQNLGIRVNVRAHELLEQDGLDLILKMPVTIKEAVEGVELKVPTIVGHTTVQMPPLATQRICLRGQGKKDPLSDLRGDLYVRPVIIPPNTSSERLKDALNTIQEHYTDDLRKDVPECLS